MGVKWIFKIMFGCWSLNLVMTQIMRPLSGSRVGLRWQVVTVCYVFVYCVCSLNHTVSSASMLLVQKEGQMSIFLIMVFVVCITLPILNIQA
jgi:hypothetical protein